jgi:hypothetical protein
MPGRKPWHDSPYDSSGMPLGCETADYDNEEERRKHMVKEKYVPEVPLNDPDYQPKQLPKTFTGQRPLTKKNFNSAINEGVGLPDPNVNVVDVEDPGERREFLVKEAEEKGFKEVPELPKVEKKETVDAIKKDIEEDDPEFFKSLNATEEKKDKDNDGVQK